MAQIHLVDMSSFKHSSGVPFFLVSISSTSHATVRPLKDWKVSQADDQKVCLELYILVVNSIPYILVICIVKMYWPLNFYFANYVVINIDAVVIWLL